MNYVVAIYGHEKANTAVSIRVDLDENVTTDFDALCEFNVAVHENKCCDWVACHAFMYRSEKPEDRIIDLWW